VTITSKLRRQVIVAADYRCEYCKTSSRLTGTPLVMEHILPRSLGGTDGQKNLAASCYRCNEFKGAKTHATDPETDQFVELFNPRSQLWGEHFAWVNGGTHVAGVTQTGRATVVALRLNNDNIVEARTFWIEGGWHPPS
jgi:HNH endonuclease